MSFPGIDVRVALPSSEEGPMPLEGAGREGPGAQEPGGWRSNNLLCHMEGMGASPA